MPILAKEDDIYPEDLLEGQTALDPEGSWSAVYTLSRREKEFMRQLRARQIPHYCPIVANKTKSPAGRIRTSHLPLFANYVFVHGTLDQRVQAFETNCVSRWLDVPNGEELRSDLRRVRSLIQTGASLTLESRLQAGTLVRVLNGYLEGQQGIVVRHQGAARLIVAVNFLQQGASVLLADADVEPIKNA